MERSEIFDKVKQIIGSIAGIDPQRIRKKAVQSKLITPAQAGQMSKRELLNLIFHPGFSTADQITDVSGRGVGMDVVRKHVQKLRGRIDVISRPGLGTTFLFTIPEAST